MSASQAQRKTLHLCLDAAMEVLDLFESGGKSVEMMGIPGREIHLDQIIAAIKLHLPDSEWSEAQIDTLGQDIAECFGHYGFTICAMWSVAHSIEHLVTDKT